MVKLADKASIPLVIAEMTVEEKVHAICSPDPVRYIVERLGIPAYTRADGHNGINMMQIMGRLPPGDGEDEVAALKARLYAELAEIEL